MSKTTRRTFIKHAGYAGAALPLVLPTLGRAKPANNKLNVAFVATSGKANVHVHTTHKMGHNCTALCDVDTRNQGRAAKNWPNAKRYQDYRAMFDKEHKNFDAVFVTTPDHHHYPAAMRALQLGKHTYCQKPLAWSVWECRQLAAEAAKQKVATQMGNQGHAGNGWRTIYDWIHGGYIGDVKEVHTWTNRPIWPQGKNRPAGSDPVPDNLNWDLWIGPAPMRPYKKGVYHSFKWRGWFDFGVGALGDMACHQMDGQFWALGTDAPKSVEVLENNGMTNEMFPNSSVIKWEYAATEKRAAYTAYWYDGKLKPKRPAEFDEKRKYPALGNFFVGTKATIMSADYFGGSPRIIPDAKLKEIGMPKQILEPAPGGRISMEDKHHLEFFLAATEQKPYNFPKSNFAYAGPMTENLLLGTVAMRAGKKIEWDGPNMKVTNVDEANALIRRKPRPGWEV
jgi:predicted dehydrogenase